MTRTRGARSETRWDEVIADPQARPGGGLIEVSDGPDHDHVPRDPVDFGGRPLEPRWMAPEPRQHTEEGAVR